MDARLLSAASMNWRSLDTLLLDMDGTVLDLAFDNYFWRELVPRVVARQRNIPYDEARQLVLEKYAKVEGTLTWYCLEYWSHELGLDLFRLKRASSQRIRYLPGALEFLKSVAKRDLRMILVTNAHDDTLKVKKGVAGLGRFFEVCFSSHRLGRPKEDPEFWPLLEASLGFEPGRTLFVDDSLPVLGAARDYGMGHILAISRPDTARPSREVRGFEAVEGLGQLTGTLPAA